VLHVCDHIVRDDQVLIPGGLVHQLGRDVEHFAIAGCGQVGIERCIAFHGGDRRGVPARRQDDSAAFTAAET
jgi:hypothetical protein